MNNIDKQYIQLVKDILENGVQKSDRTGTGTISVFGRQIRHKMSEGFPLLTTKKMAFKTMVVELLWFLKGDTNIKYLVDNNCHIWDGDAYKRYCKVAGSYEQPDYTVHIEDPKENRVRLFTQQEFIEKIKTDDEFVKVWGELGKIYGKQWRQWIKTIPYDLNEENCKMAVQATDQIEDLINSLKTNPDSRRLMVNAWNVGDLPNMVLPPCHYGFQVYTRELGIGERLELASKKYSTFDIMDFGIPFQCTHEDIDSYYPVPTRAVSLMFNMRSTDVPLGLPFNIASYGLLLEIIGRLVNMVTDELIANLGDAHIYLNQIEGIKEQLDRRPYPLPHIVFMDEFHYLMDVNIPFSEKIEQFEPKHFVLVDYQSHPKINLPLSN
jgi:thymidylate synthase